MIADALFDAIISEASRYSDQTQEGLRFFGRAFVEAHEKAPGGLSLEVGTRGGGSALMFLRLLQCIYPSGEAPMLFTIDPYGNKPYDGGDTESKASLYGNQHFVAMKSLLWPFPNHVHWYGEARRVLHCLGDDLESYWWQGTERGISGDLTFAFLDGEHSARSIQFEVGVVRSSMRSGGIIAIDNIDKDPETAKIYDLRAAERRDGRALIRREL